MAYWQWGNLTVPMWFVTNARAVKTRVGILMSLRGNSCGRSLANAIRVVCDVVGRGEKRWLTDSALQIPIMRPTCWPCWRNSMPKRP
jgi:hypothetical protein